MKGKWIGLGCVIVAVLAIVAYKRHTPVPVNGAVITSAHATSTTRSEIPTVLLVTDLNEAGESGDGCSEIIHAVHAAKVRGIKVAEFMPNSPSPLLKQYRVVSVPTVVIIDKDGRESARFVGESASTVQAIKAKLATLRAD